MVGRLCCGLFEGGGSSMSSPKSRDHINSIDSIPHLLICSDGYAETKAKKETSQNCLRKELEQGNFV